MLNPTKNFRMKKQWKRLLATFPNPVQRASLKYCYIQAQLFSEQKPVKEKKSNSGAALATA